jgi:hypothetical protein
LAVLLGNPLHRSRAEHGHTIPLAIILVAGLRRIQWRSDATRRRDRAALALGAWQPDQHALDRVALGVEAVQRRPDASVRCAKAYRWSPHKG